MARWLKRPLNRHEDLSSDLQKWGFPELLSPSSAFALHSGPLLTSCSSSCFPSP